MEKTVSVLTLLDELEEALASCRRVPLTEKLLVDEDLIFTFIQRIRTQLPDEIKEAHWIINERDRLLEEARERSDKLVATAKEDVQRLAEESAIVREAQEKSQKIVDEGRRVAQEIRAAAIQYADEVLESVQEQLVQKAEEIRRGREELRS